ncbi:glycine-rich cell wall structural protein-like [Rhododendron vialii]|uniref:glycine-rich cell wall structural protein-like n=1 Tax=Rhododendron vialii TaxID=182163 RepID=UPI00265EDE5D|nr:glycine-rich cell wall structural protein-like [Rhododendron vialii]
MLEHGGYQAYGHGGHGWEHHSRGGFRPHGRGGFHPYGRGGGHPGHGWGLHVPPHSRGWPQVPFVRPHGHMAQGCGADIHGGHLVPPHGYISEDWGPHMFHERCIHGADGGEDHNHGADGGRGGCHGRGGRGYGSRGRGGSVPRGRGGEGHEHDLGVFISEDLGPHMFPERCIHGADGGEDDHNHGATHSGGRGGCRGRGGHRGGRHHWHGGRGGEGHEHDLDVLIVGHIPDITSTSA